MGGYSQYCPVAKALELLDERWTVLVVRELLSGGKHFNAIRRGIPRMSPALLSKRLQRLDRAGVVDRHPDGNRCVYQLTPLGEELRPVIEALGAWGMRWIAEFTDEDLDPQLLMWDLHRNVTLGDLPPGRTTLHFRFCDLPAGRSREWWLVMSKEGTEVCDFDPGFPVAGTVTANLVCLTRVWRGELGWREALRSGAVEIHGPTRVQRAVPRWLGQSPTCALSAP